MRKLFAALFLAVLLVAPAWADDLKTSLVSYWNLTETSGTREDSHGSNDLTDNNTVGYSAEAWGNAADFEKDNSEYLSIADGSQSGLDPGSSDVTIAVWVKPESQFPNWESTPLMSKGEQGIRILWGSNGATNDSRIGLVFDRGGAWSWHWSSVAALSNGSLYLVVCRWDVATHTVTFTVNNSSAGSDATGTGTPVNDSDAFRLARDYYGNYFDGVMGPVGYWTRELSDAELTTLYNSGTPLLYADLVPPASMRRRVPIVW